MADSASLPYRVPWFAFTQGHAAPGLAMAGHPTAYNSYLNQCTTLNCSRRFLFGYTSPLVAISRGCISDFACLEKYATSARFCYPYHKELIKQMIDEGFYVYFSEVDDYYLPGKSWYGIRHMLHDGIICGYDESDQTYSIAAYDINWVFNLIRIPQECFAEGYRVGMNGKNYGSFLAYKVKEEEVRLNENMILSNLKDYISKTGDIYSLKYDTPVDGIAVHDFLAMYIDKLKDGSIPADKMDWRALRPVWEHKRCMLDRIRAIEEKRGWNADLSTRYQPLVEDANRVRMMYAVYHKNQKTGLLDKIKTGILSFRDQEYEILKELIQKMEEEK